jgi:plasmid stability protein
MSTHRRSALADHRHVVTQRITAGEPFGYVEDAIDAADDLSMDEKAALWLFAFSLRPTDDQRRDAWGRLAALG